MTVVIEKYRSNDGTFADIQQEKYSTLYQLDIYSLIDSAPLAQSVFRSNYTSIKSARQAMKRYGTGWKREVI